MGDDQPLIRVVRGTPTAEELAALVGTLVTRTRSAAGNGRESAPATSGWVRSGRAIALDRTLPTHRGPQAWRDSPRWSR